MQGSSTPGGVEIGALRAKIVYLFFVGWWVGARFALKINALRAKIFVFCRMGVVKKDAPCGGRIFYLARLFINLSSNYLTITFLPPLM